MEALARRIGFWPIQPAPLWKLAESYRAHKPLDSTGISHDAGVEFLQRLPINQVNAWLAAQSDSEPEDRPWTPPLCYRPISLGTDR